MARKRKPLAPDDVVDRFIETVYPELGELARMSATEESILTDATETIIELREKVKRLEKERGQLMRCVRLHGMEKYDDVFRALADDD